MRPPPRGKPLAAPQVDWSSQRWLDRELQRQRIAQVRHWIVPGSTVLDIGCGDGALFRALGATMRRGVGIDPRLRQEFAGHNWVLHPGLFPDDVPQDVAFDAITLLAVLEHLPPGVQQRLGATCRALLGPGGRVLITVPSPRVDAILAVLIRIGLVGGQAEEEHWGFDPSSTAQLFPEPGFELCAMRAFQLGLNNLFVFVRR